jgi:hypothetical protein
MNHSKVSWSVTSSARPASLASPFGISGSTIALCSANRGSRWRSFACAAVGHHAEPDLTVAERRFLTADPG